MPEKPSYKELQQNIQNTNQFGSGYDESASVLQESQEKFRLVFNSAGIGMALVDLEGRILDSNPALQQMLGYTEEELRGTSFTEITLPEEIIKEWRAACELFKGKRDSYRMTKRYIRKDGQVLWGKLTATLYRDAENQPGFAIGMLEDITEQKMAEQALVQSEKKWRNVLVHTPQAGISLNPAGQIVFANEHFLTLTGYTEQEVLGRDWFELFIPGHMREQIRGVFKKTMQRKDIQEYSVCENEILTKSGKLRNLAWANVLTKSVDGGVTDVTCLGLDLTERKRARKALRRQARAIHLNNRIANIFLISRSEELYAEVLEVILEELESRFGYFGYIDEEENLVCPSMTRNIWDRCQVPDKRIVFPKSIWGGLWGRSLMEKKTLTANEGLILPEGHVQLENALIVPVVYKNRLIGQLGVANKSGGYGEEDRKLLENVASQTAPILKARLDEYQQKKIRRKLENQLRQAQKMEAVGTLAGGIAHDFNNILSSIIGYTDVTMSEIDPASKAHGYLQNVLNAGDRATQLVRQILDFSRQSEQEQRPMLVNQIAKEALKLLKSSTPSTITIESSIREDLPVIIADPTQIYQVIMNLGTNAVQAMQETGGRLLVNIETTLLDQKAAASYPNLSPGEFIQLSVSDTGPGIPERIKDSIFNAYFTTKSEGEGTGLGLAVVYSIVQGLGGAISVSSVPGDGATFIVYLPVEESKELSAPEDENGESDEPLSINAGSGRILFVDDEPPITDIGKTILEELGYNVETRTSPLEALERFRATPEQFDLLITDWTMPHMTGDRLAGEIQVLRPGFPVILCSGFYKTLSPEYAETSGIQTIIHKPIRRKELARAVANILSGHVSDRKKH